MSVEVLIELWANRPLRGDLDNYAKGVLDGLIKGGVLDDDRQVSRLVVQPMIDPDAEERVEVILRGDRHDR